MNFNIFSWWQRIYTCLTAKPKRKKSRKRKRERIFKRLNYGKAFFISLIIPKDSLDTLHMRFPLMVPPPLIPDNFSSKRLKDSSRLNMLTLAYFSSASNCFPPLTITFSSLKSFSQSTSSLHCSHANAEKQYQVIWWIYKEKKWKKFSYLRGYLFFYLSLNNFFKSLRIIYFLT